MDLHLLQVRKVIHRLTYQLATNTNLNEEKNKFKYLGCILPWWINFFSPLRFDFYFCLTVQPSGSEGGLTFQELEMEMHTLIHQSNFPKQHWRKYPRFKQPRGLSSEKRKCKKWHFVNLPSYHVILKGSSTKKFSIA